MPREMTREVARFTLVGDLDDPAYAVTIMEPSGRCHDEGRFPSITEAVAYVEQWARERGCTVQPVLVLEVDRRFLV